MRSYAVAVVAGCLLVAGLDVSRALAQPRQPQLSARPGMATEQLVSQPKLAKLVDALAARSAVNLARFGGESGQDKLPQILAKIEAVTTPTQRLSLLRHQSPTVRGYAVRFWLNQDREAVLAAETLLDDDIQINTIHDCRVTGILMCDFVLRQVAPALLKDRLVQIAQTSTNRCKLTALRALAAEKHPRVAALAEPLLREQDPSLQALGIELLGHVPSAQSADQVRALASSSPHVEVRAAAAAALHAWPQPASESVLRTLMDQDPSPAVRALAAQSYVQQPTRDLQWIKQRRLQDKKRIKEAIELGLAYDGRPDSLELLRSWFIPQVDVAEVFWQSILGPGYAGNVVSSNFIDLLKELRSQKISKELARKIDSFLTQWEEYKHSSFMTFRSIGTFHIIR